MTTIVTEQPHACTIRVWHGEDWYDPLPQLVDHLGNPFDLTGKVLELFARPSFDHAVRFELLTSSASDGIRFTDAANGLAEIFLSQANVEATLPISTSTGWRQFLRLSWDDPIYGAVSKHIWIGSLIVYPARDSA